MRASKYRHVYVEAPKVRGVGLYYRKRRNVMFLLELLLLFALLGNILCAPLF